MVPFIIKGYHYTPSILGTKRFEHKGFILYMMISYRPDWWTIVRQVLAVGGSEHKIFIRKRFTRKGSDWDSHGLALDRAVWREIYLNYLKLWRILYFHIFPNLDTLNMVICFFHWNVQIQVSFVYNPRERFSASVKVSFKMLVNWGFSILYNSIKYSRHFESQPCVHLMKTRHNWHVVKDVKVSKKMPGFG